MKACAISVDWATDWERRIISEAKKILFCKFASIALSLGLRQKVITNYKKETNKKLSDYDFVQRRSKLGDWHSKIATAENPEKKEHDLAKGLAFVIRQEVLNAY